MGATIIDGTGGLFRPDTAIVVRGERIEALAPAAQLKVSAGAEVVDVKNQYAVPGFINSHEHLATPPANPLQNIDAVRQVVLTVKRSAQYPRQNYTPVTKAKVEGYF